MEGVAVAAAAPIAPVIHVQQRYLRIGNFVPPESELSIGKAWDDWIDDLEAQFRYFKLNDTMDKKKADAIKIFEGEVIKRLAKTLPNPTE